jgi:choice-of-anchor A domain-containing protein
MNAISVIRPSDNTTHPTQSAWGGFVGNSVGISIQEQEIDMRTHVLLGAAVALAGTISAEAASVFDYNYIVSNDSTFNASTAYGTMAVGNNMHATNNSDFKKSLTVNGQVNGTFSLESGALTYGAIAPGTTVTYGPGATGATGSYDATTYTAMMHDLSGHYASLAANSIAPTTANPIFAVTPDVGNVAVFSVDGGIFRDPDFSGGWSFSGLSNDVTVIINVTGNSVTFSKGTFSDTGYNGRILWNFVDATEVNINQIRLAFYGALLAPNPRSNSITTTSTATSTSTICARKTTPCCMKCRSTDTCPPAIRRQFPNRPRLPCCCRSRRAC